MNESESKNEKLKEERRQEQYDMLKRCSDKKDMTEWNEWREEYSDEEICLDDKNLNNFYLQQANFMKGTRQEKGVYTEYSGEIYLRKATFEDAKIQGVRFSGAHLEETMWYYAKTDENTCFSGAFLNGANFYGKFDGCDFKGAILIEATLSASSLKGAKFMNSDLRGCHAQAAIVDEHTIIFKPKKINRFSKSKRYTDFEGVALGNIIIDPATKQLLEYNIRRKNWEGWYKYKDWYKLEPERERNKRSQFFLKSTIGQFWEISDYGISTKQIIKTFFKLAFVFAIIYYIWGFIDYYLVGIKDFPGIVSDLFVLEDNKEAVSCWLVPFRAVYFSIVTMTTLGFGDMYANAHSFLRGLLGHTLLALQVILGYVLLGALVTRFAVLFTAGGPAGRFANEQKKKDEKKSG